MQLTLNRLLLSCCVLLISSGAAFACQCEEGVIVSDSFRDADAVFLGEVERVVTKDLSVEAELKVEKSWKGVDTETVTLLSWATNCYLHFEAGRSYLIFGSKNQDGKYQERACSHAARAADAGKQLEYLRSKPTIPLKAVPPKSRVVVVTVLLVSLFVTLGIFWQRFIGRAA